jgi:uncharacterized protein (TIGR02217 family)
MSFSDNVVFPTEISYGSSTYFGGRQVRIISLPGSEKRQSRRLHSIRRFNVKFGIKTEDQLNSVLHIWESHGQTEEGFLYKDFADFKSCIPSGTITHTDQQIGVGDGATTVFQLTKGFIAGSQTYSKVILKPKVGTTVVGKDGVLQGSGFTISTILGTVTFSAAPAGGVIISAGFEYYIPVRFDIEEFEVNLSHFKRGELPDIMLKELLDPNDA